MPTLILKKQEAKFDLEKQIYNKEGLTLYFSQREQHRTLNKENCKG